MEFSQRGRHKRELKQDNMLAIEDWYKWNPYGTQKECAEYLGLSRFTVCKHVKELRKQREV